MDEKTDLVFLYEPQQVGAALSYFKKNNVKITDGFLIVPLDYEVELELEKRGVPFCSMIKLCDPPDGKRESIEFTRMLAREWYRTPEVNFFTHDGISLAESQEVMFLYYFQTVVYYLSVLDQIIGSFVKLERIWVPESFEKVSPTADLTAGFKVRAPLAVARLLGKKYGVEVRVLPRPFVERMERRFFVWSRMAANIFYGWVVFFVNSVVNLFVRPRPLKIFAVDPWSHIGPFINKMDNAELVMLVRKELRMMGWEVWRRRVRFHHRLDFVDGNARRIARAVVVKFQKRWKALGDEPPFARLFCYREISFWPLVKPLFDSLILHHAEDLILTIEGIRQILLRYHINRIILFSSTKGYNYLIARLAHRLQISAIELQHAAEVTELSYPHSRLPAEYLASYGALTKKHYVNFGVAPERILECGSPRFDRYLVEKINKKDLAILRQRLNLDQGRFTMLVIVPPVYMSLEYGHYTSYADYRFLAGIAELKKYLPEIQLILKIRPWSTREQFFYRVTEKIFPKGAVIAQYESMHHLMQISDLVVSSSSTSVVEALILGKPVVMFVPNEIDHDFQEYADAGALFLARTGEELLKRVNLLVSDVEARKHLVEQARKFLKENFMFDGRSSERFIEFLNSYVS